MLFSLPPSVFNQVCHISDLSERERSDHKQNKDMKVGYH